jgi:hypothetical protein
MSEHPTSTWLTPVITTLEHYVQQLHQLMLSIPEELFDAKLHPDMLDLKTNALIALNFVPRSLYRVLATEVNSFEPKSIDKQSLLLQAEDTLAFIRQHASSKSPDETAMVTDQAGVKTITLPALNYMHLFAIPNMLFHCSIVYAIARMRNEPMSKGDFDGFHHYPSGYKG